MSGRSAIVRAKNDGSKKSSSHAKSSSHSNVRILPASSGRRESASDQGGSQGYADEYGTYPAQQPYYGSAGYRLPREIVVETAIEKSAVRSQVDDLSDQFRGRLGRMLGGKGSKNKASKSASGNVNEPSSPTVHAVPSLSYTTSTEPQSQSLPPNFPFHNPRSKSSARQVVTQYQQESASSIHSQGRPEISVFAGHRERRSVTPWRNLAHPPESLATSVDTLVKLFVPTQEAQPLATFYVNSEVLRKYGCRHWLDTLMDRAPSLGGDAETVSSTASIPDYVADGPTPYSDGSRYNRTPKVRHELFLDCPDEALDLNPMTWAMATRNLFAILHDHDYICGRTLFEALSQLSARLLGNSDGLPPTVARSSFLLDYLTRHRFLDARNSSAYALSMLAFSQLSAIQWKEGSVESFVHCVGLRLYGTFNTAEAQHISPYINVLITNMANELRKRLKRSQKYFASMEFSDMWPANIPLKSGGRAAFERFRVWLMQYLLRNDPTLREAIANEELWMTHERIDRYKKIFHSLFDYLVNRDVEFDDTSDLKGYEPSIVSKSGLFFKADPNAELPMTGILTTFDTSRRFPHLPAPYPLVPPSQPPSKSRHGNSKKAVSSSDSEEELEARSASYAEASNFELVAHDMNMDPIIAEFISFEETDEIGNVDPRDARLGRWVLIYGALQVLAPIETVTPGVRFRDGARYCMSCKVAGVLPWVKDREGQAPQELRSPTHEMAYPFLAPLKWPRAVPKPRTGSYRTIVSPEYGDGRKRPDLSQSPPSRPGGGDDGANRPTSSGRPGILQTFGASSDKRQAAGSARSGRGGLVESSSAEEKAARERLEADKARARREKTFGFTNYKPEAGW